MDRAMICNPKALAIPEHLVNLLQLIGFLKTTLLTFPHNESIFITNQQGLPTMSSSQEMKSQLLKKLSVLKREFILQQEVKLKAAVSIFQVRKNIICFLLLLPSGMSKEWGERPTEECLPFNLQQGKTVLPTELILGDPGAVSRAGRKGATKVFKYRRKSPWVPTLTGPFPNSQANAGS